MNTSKLTREALARLKAQGVQLGNPNIHLAQAASCVKRTALADAYSAEIGPVIQELKSDGLSTLQEIADSLNRRGYRTRRNKEFYPSTVRGILQRIRQKETK